MPTAQQIAAIAAIDAQIKVLEGQKWVVLHPNTLTVADIPATAQEMEEPKKGVLGGKSFPDLIDLCKRGGLKCGGSRETIILKLLALRAQLVLAEALAVAPPAPEGYDSDGQPHVAAGNMFH